MMMMHDCCLMLGEFFRDECREMRVGVVHVCLLTGSTDHDLFFPCTKTRANAAS